MKIFISYRREDSIHITGRIYDRLVARFGRKSIYKDVDSIPFGIDFRDHFEHALLETDLVLVMIGDQWLDIKGEDGERRLEMANDFVRLEVETALNRNIRVIPLFVGRATNLDESKLPTPLKPLVYRNGLQIRSDPDFHKDVDRLIKDIETFESGILRSISIRKDGEPEPKKKKPAPAGKTPPKIFSGAGKPDIWKAVGLHLVSGAGLFAINRNLWRAWLYPLAFLAMVGFYIYYGIAESFGSILWETRIQLAVGIPAGVWLVGFVDVIVTWRKK